MATKRKRLWEARHPYRCHELPWHDPEATRHWYTWAAFFEEEGDADLDLNLLVRWDWRAAEETGDEVLFLAFLTQRKGFLRTATVDVTREDELAVLRYLRPRWTRLRQIWAPLSRQVRS